MTENEIARIIVDTDFHIHRDLGPGLFETVYERIMNVELTKRGLTVIRQKPIPIIYNEVHFEAGFRCDLMVESREVKSIEALHPVH
jgi:GxxExxY protein